MLKIYLNPNVDVNFQQGNASCHSAAIVQDWFQENEGEFILYRCLPFPTNSISYSHWTFLGWSWKTKKTFRSINIQSHTNGKCYSSSMISDFTNDLSPSRTVHTKNNKGCIKGKSPTKYRRGGHKVAVSVLNKNLEYIHVHSYKFLRKDKKNSYV